MQTWGLLYLIFATALAVTRRPGTPNQPRNVGRESASTQTETAAANATAAVHQQPTDPAVQQPQTPPEANQAAAATPGPMGNLTGACPGNAQWHQIASQVMLLNSLMAQSHSLLSILTQSQAPWQLIASEGSNGPVTASGTEAASAPGAVAQGEPQAMASAASNAQPGVMPVTPATPMTPMPWTPSENMQASGSNQVPPHLVPPPPPAAALPPPPAQTLPPPPPAPRPSSAPSQQSTHLPSLANATTPQPRPLPPLPPRPTSALQQPTTQAVQSRSRSPRGHATPSQAPAVLPRHRSPRAIRRGRGEMQEFTIRLRNKRMARARNAAAMAPTEARVGMLALRTTELHAHHSVQILQSGEATMLASIAQGIRELHFVVDELGGHSKGIGELHACQQLQATKESPAPVAQEPRLCGHPHRRRGGVIHCAAACGAYVSSWWDESVMLTLPLVHDAPRDKSMVVRNLDLGGLSSWLEASVMATLHFVLPSPCKKKTICVCFYCCYKTAYRLRASHMMSVLPLWQRSVLMHRLELSYTYQSCCLVFMPNAALWKRRPDTRGDLLSQVTQVLPLPVVIDALLGGSFMPSSLTCDVRRKAGHFPCPGGISGLSILNALVLRGELVFDLPLPSVWACMTIALCHVRACAYVCLSCMTCFLVQRTLLTIACACHIWCHSDVPAIGNSVSLHEISDYILGIGSSFSCAWTEPQYHQEVSVYTRCYSQCSLGLLHMLSFLDHRQSPFALLEQRPSSIFMRMHDLPYTVGPWQHPWANVRVGEARQPGPEASAMSSPGRRLRRKSAPPHVHVDPEHVRVAVGQASSSDHAHPQVHAAPPVALPQPPGEPGEEAAGLNPNGHVIPGPIDVLLATGTASTLKCVWVKNSASWRWQLGPKAWKATKDSRLGPRRALLLWQARHAQQLNDESQQRVREVLATLDDSRYEIPAPRGNLRDACPAPPLHTLHIKVPAPEECMQWLDADPSLLLRFHVKTQRRVPSSMQTHIADVLATLWSLSSDPMLHTCQRQLCRLMVITAPRWGWPEPTRPASGRLLPHSRPKVIKERLSLLQSGHWQQLWDLAIPDDIVPAEDAMSTANPPEPPGLISQSRLHPFKRATAHTHVGKSWKQLWGWGSPSPSTHTAAKLEAKLTPSQAHPDLPLADPAASEVHVADILRRCTSEVWDKALGSYKPGKAFDALGWSPESFMYLAKHPRTLHVTKTICQGLLTSEIDRCLLPYLTLSKAVALYKGADASIRPLSVQTMFRKCTGALSVAIFRMDMEKFMSFRQYGSGMCNGLACMSLSLDTLMTARPDFVHVKLDVHNAFTEVSRASVASALADIHPLLPITQAHWINNPTAVLLSTSVHERRVLRLDTGIPQGDPCSSWFFSACMEQAKRRLQQMASQEGLIEGSDYDIHLYIDDVVLSSTVKDLPKLTRMWHDILVTYSLTLHADKSQAYSPSVPAAQMAYHLQIPIARCSEEGIILCGAPLPNIEPVDLESSRVDDSISEDSVPVGNDVFHRRFLSHKLRLLQKKCAAAVTLAESVAQGGVHLALYLIRVSVLSSCFHLLRGMPLRVTHPWSSQCDQVILRTCMELLGITSLHDHQTLLLQLPPGFGGLGLLSLYVEAPLLAISQQLHLRSLGTIPETHKSAWSSLEALTWAVVARHLDIPAVLKLPVATLLRVGLPHATKLLRRARYTQMCPPGPESPCPYLAGTGGVRADNVSLTPFQEHCANSAWFVQPSSGFVDDFALRVHIRMRLGMAIYTEGEPCSYISRTTGRSCLALKDIRGDHPNSCCRALVIARHHQVRDLIHDVATSASCFSCLEQVVDLRLHVPGGVAPQQQLNPFVPPLAQTPLCPESPVHSPVPATIVDTPQSDVDLPSVHAEEPLPAAAANPRTERRADVVLIPLHGPRQLIDVGIVHVPINEHAYMRIEQVQNDKLHEYAVRGVSSRTPAGDKMTPFIVSSLGIMGPCALALLWQLSGMQVSHNVRQPRQWEVRQPTQLAYFYTAAASMGRKIVQAQAAIVRGAGSPVC